MLHLVYVFSDKIGQDVGGNLCQDCLSDPITCNPADRNPGVQSAAEGPGRFAHRPRKNENALYKQSSLTVRETKMHYIESSLTVLESKVLSKRVPYSLMVLE